jgi:TonB family protein
MLNAERRIVDSQVISGPEELRQAALQLALQGSYTIDSARSLQVVVEFKLPDPNVPPAGRLNGTVSDAAGTALIGALVTATSDQGAIFGSRTSETGQFGFSGLPLGVYRVSAESTGFQSQFYADVRLAGRPVRLSFFLQGGDSSTPPVVISAPSVPADQPIRVGGAVQQTYLLRQIAPQYPPAAREARLQGVVVFEALITKEGRIGSLKAVTGNPILIEAAKIAVAQWVYRPTVVNGQPVEVVTPITVNFAFSN